VRPFLSSIFPGDILLRFALARIFLVPALLKTNTVGGDALLLPVIPITAHSSSMAQE
jgi:hypothetical protein